MEAELFKKKFPGQGKPPKQSASLQKRLQGQVKYFDSGDYNMAKGNQKKRCSHRKKIPTVDEIPTRIRSSSKLSSLAEGVPAGQHLQQEQDESDENGDNGMMEKVVE